MTFAQVSHGRSQALGAKTCRCDTDAALFGGTGVDALNEQAATTPAAMQITPASITPRIVNFIFDPRQSTLNHSRRQV
jgi:hypothetical protein